MSAFTTYSKYHRPPKAPKAPNSSGAGTGGHPYIPPSKGHVRTPTVPYSPSAPPTRTSGVRRTSTRTAAAATISRSPTTARGQLGATPLGQELARLLTPIEASHVPLPRVLSAAAHAVSSFLGDHGYGGTPKLKAPPMPKDQTPIFTGEGPKFYAQAKKVNAPFAKPGPYQTKLGPRGEASFQAWAKLNKASITPDYNMRGFWRASGGAPHKPGTHFPDTFKTPLDTSFSNQSRYSRANNPRRWRGDQLVNTNTGRVVYGPTPQARRGRVRQRVGHPGPINTENLRPRLAALPGRQQPGPAVPAKKIEALKQGAIDAARTPGVGDDAAALRALVRAEQGKKPGQASPKQQKMTRYVNPFPSKDWTPGRTDQGYDLSPKRAGAPIKAIGHGTVLSTNTPGRNPNGWPGGGGIFYRLTKGPKAGRIVFTTEGVNPTVKPGQRLRPGDQIGAAVAGVGVESGYYTGPTSESGHPLHNQGYKPNQREFPTIGGKAFTHLANRLEAKGSLTVPAGGAAGSVSPVEHVANQIRKGNYNAGPGQLVVGGSDVQKGQEPEIAARLKLLSAKIGKPIFIISGYRSPAHSVSVGGFADDPHTKATAADIGVGSALRASAGSISDAQLASVGLHRPYGGATEINHVELLPGAAKSLPQAQVSISQRRANHVIAKHYSGWGVDPGKVAAVARSAKHNDVPPQLLMAIGKVESSNGSSNAQGVKSGANYAGAQGPFQFLQSSWETTAKKLWGSKWTQHSVYNYGDAAMAAGRYLKDAGYDGTPAGAQKAVYSYNHSGTYVSQVLGLAQQANHPAWDQAGGFVPLPTPAGAAVSGNSAAALVAAGADPTAVAAAQTQQKQARQASMPALVQLAPPVAAGPVLPAGYQGLSGGAPSKVPSLGELLAQLTATSNKPTRRRRVAP